MCLAIEINIALEIIISSSSSADKREGTGNLKEVFENLKVISPWSLISFLIEGDLSEFWRHYKKAEEILDGKLHFLCIQIDLPRLLRV